MIKFNKGISAPAGITIILLVAFLVFGGILEWQRRIIEETEKALELKISEKALELKISEKVTKDENKETKNDMFFQDWEKYGAKEWSLYLGQEEANLIYPLPDKIYFPEIKKSYNIDLDNDGIAEKIFWVNFLETKKITEKNKKDGKIVYAGGPPGPDEKDVLFIYDNSNNFLDNLILSTEGIHPGISIIDAVSIDFEDINKDNLSEIIIREILSGSGSFANTLIFNLQEEKLVFIFGIGGAGGSRVERKDLNDDGTKELIHRYAFASSGAFEKDATRWLDIYQWNGKEYELANDTFPSQHEELVDYYQNLISDIEKRVNEPLFGRLDLVKCFSKAAIRASQGFIVHPDKSCEW